MTQTYTFFMVLLYTVFMNPTYIAFDVETPNMRNNRISSIGIAVVENNKITDSFTTLVNPETYFQSFNIALTGIDDTLIKDAPAFPQLWKQIEPIFNSGILIAHNAPFDMRVLSHCLNDYQIEWKSEVDYACTCRMGQACYPFLTNHKLNTMCDALHIDLDHHKADSDSLACAKLLLSYQKNGLSVEQYIRRYDLIHSRTIQQ